jgi:hypothetical protein
MHYLIKTRWEMGVCRWQHDPTKHNMSYEDFNQFFNESWRLWAGLTLTKFRPFHCRKMFETYARLDLPMAPNSVFRPILLTHRYTIPMEVLFRLFRLNMVFSQHGTLKTILTVYISGYGLLIGRATRASGQVRIVHRTFVYSTLGGHGEM